MLTPESPICSKDNYTDGSQYEKNLDELFTTLSTAALDNGWFYNGSAGAGTADEVFGFIMCYADRNAIQCHECLAKAGAGIKHWCPGSRSASAMYDACVLRYSDEPIPATADLDAVYAEYVPIPGSKKQAKIFEQGREHEMKKGGDFDEPEMEDEFEKGTGPKRFGYAELAIATDNFSDKHKLGEGGFGSVYRGFLKEMNLDVAIKRVSKGSKQGRKEYASEVRIISRIRHRNLVQLIGWCHDAGELHLVYELMPNGSLDTHLYSSNIGGALLPWPQRHEIVLGLGSALLYLHQDWEQCVLHRDIKPSNVMLDASFNAKLGDFGLARLVDHGRGSHTTVLAGTMGYMDPECMITGRSSAHAAVHMCEMSDQAFTVKIIRLRFPDHYPLTHPMSSVSFAVLHSIRLQGE
ncbi:hypothetical protein HU200_039768 [Digitaria exilis]|uniref:Uncharacterized protein n=1 Tax=Digitaria exilis TaxID=1010633 RepID=A0A835B9R2_9POAL|nr:hypothetical protein HU200_039768 [Digitaria exilis]